MVKRDFLTVIQGPFGNEKAESASQVLHLNQFVLREPFNSTPSAVLPWTSGPTALPFLQTPTQQTVKFCLLWPQTMVKFAQKRWKNIRRNVPANALVDRSVHDRASTFFERLGRFRATRCVTATHRLLACWPNYNMGQYNHVLTYPPDPSQSLPPSLLQQNISSIP